MIGLFLRKSLYEIWDTLLYSLVFNFAVTMATVAEGLRYRAARLVRSKFPVHLHHS